MHKAASETYHETCSAFLLREVIWIIMRFKFSILLKEFENFGFLMISIASILLSTYYTSYLQYDQKCIFISSYPAFLPFSWDQEKDPVDRSLLWLKSFFNVYLKKIRKLDYPLLENYFLVFRKCRSEIFWTAQLSSSFFIFLLQLFFHNFILTLLQKMRK